MKTKIVKLPQMILPGCNLLLWIFQLCRLQVGVFQNSNLLGILKSRNTFQLAADVLSAVCIPAKNVPSYIGCIKSRTVTKRELILFEYGLQYAIITNILTGDTMELDNEKYKSWKLTTTNKVDYHIQKAKFPFKGVENCVANKNRIWLIERWEPSSTPTPIKNCFPSTYYSKIPSLYVVLGQATISKQQQCFKHGGDAKKCSYRILFDPETLPKSYPMQPTWLPAGMAYIPTERTYLSPYFRMLLNIN